MSDVQNNSPLPEPIDFTTPEKAGVPSKAIEKYIRLLEKKGFATHNLILARGNHIFFENYWQPFHRETLHRMYSVTKSFVSLAIGFLEQDKMICLDDEISKYFPKELEHQTDENMRRQTIRHMLMMSTAKYPQNWFNARSNDRVQSYFDNDTINSRPSGTIFNYDSNASFILCALVERLTGMTFMDYMWEKLFRKIGVSKDAYCLKCPGGHSWGDSALICRPMDLFLTARFVMNGGKWNDEQILNKEYIDAATSKQIDNNLWNLTNYESHGYGYQFWRSWQDSYLFNGMGCQWALCMPDKDLIMVYNADNQGKVHSHEIIDLFFDLIADSVSQDTLPEDPAAHQRLLDYAKDLKLLVQKGEAHSPECEDEVDGVTYVMDENPMGISRIRLTFQGDKGCFAYTNAQGDKEIHFGLGYNEFGLFPQEGYSSDVGSVYAPGNYYKCACSGAWVEKNKLCILVQVIDRYLGNMDITIGFQKDKVGIAMVKIAEDFLNEYEGFAGGTRIS